MLNLLFQLQIKSSVKYKQKSILFKILVISDNLLNSQ